MYSNAKYIKTMGQNVVIEVQFNNDIICVPIYDENPVYQEIMQLVEEGKLTIAPADEVSN